MTEKKLLYKAFGLNLLSDLSLPELPQISHPLEMIDIYVEISDLSEQWSEMVENSQQKMIIKENLYMFCLQDMAIFCVQNGNKIVISPTRNADFDQIRLFILGTCMGALLLQRKILPLHGSSVVIDGKAYAFIGERGAGKSTIAAAFLRKGYELLTDDVIAVTLEGAKPYVIPSYPQQKLWKKSLIEFGENAEKFRPLYDRETKYAVPVHDKYNQNSIPMGGIFELVKMENDQIIIQSILGLERLRKLFIHTFRQYLLNGFGLQEWHFNITTGLTKHISIFQIQRPQAIFTADLLVTLVLEKIKEGGKTRDRNTETYIEV